MSFCCPDTYTYNVNTGQCERLAKADAVLNPAPVLPLPVCPSATFNYRGTAVYATIETTQFPLMGITNTQPMFQDANDDFVTPYAYISGPLWKGNDISGGRLNQAGIGLLPPIGEWQGYSRCITVEEDDVYSIAVSADYGFRIYVDGELAVYYKPTLPIKASDYLHVFPMALGVGTHSVLIEGLSGAMTERTCADKYGVDIPCTSDLAMFVPDECPNLGAFVCEVYKNITAQILSDTLTQGDLNLLYGKYYTNGIGNYITTLLLIGSPTDTGKNGNYTCDTGRINSCEEGNIVCKYTETETASLCCFKLTNCVTGATLLTTSDLTPYVDKVIKINEQSGCFLINYNTTLGCTGSQVVTFKSMYNDCDTCGLTYYKLVDCNGIASNIITTTDLSSYLNKIITIEGYNACWYVLDQQETTGAISVTVVESFDTCQEC